MAKKKKSAKRRPKSKKPAAAAPQQSQDPIGDLIKRLSKKNKNGEIRGILTITLGTDVNSSNLQWAGQTPAEEMIGPITIAERLYIDTILDRMKRAQPKK